MNITSEILKEKLRFIEISARKLHLSVIILGLKVKFLKIKVLDYIIRLSISMTISLLTVLWLYSEMKHKWSILDLHFSYPTKFNTEEFFFFS